MCLARYSLNFEQLYGPNRHNWSRGQRRHETASPEDRCKEDQKPIFGLASDCDDLFKRAVISFEGADESEMPRQLLDEMQTRFSSWAAYLGVFASPKANLDVRLKRHTAHRDLVLLALDMLRLNLAQRRRAKILLVTALC